MMYCPHKLARLHSRHPLRNLDQTISVPDHSVSEDLAEFIPLWSKEPSGCKLPRRQWVQLNKLRSRSGRFADDMHRWGLSETSACDCGSEVQTCTHILRECPIWKPPCHLTEVENLLLQNYLQNCNFGPELFSFLCFFFVYTNKKNGVAFLRCVAILVLKITSLPKL